jgi:hypothetical protein
MVWTYQRPTASMRVHVCVCVCVCMYVCMCIYIYIYIYIYSLCCCTVGHWNCRASNAVMTNEWEGILKEARVS